jgi:hypothetical protein
MKTKSLSKREIAFIEFYCRSWKGAASARAAGISQKNSAQWAYETLKKPYIQETINARLMQLRMGTEEIYARLSEQARTDLSELLEFYDVPILDKEGEHVGDRQAIRVKPEAFERFGHLFKSITPTSSGDFKVELHDAQRALELLGRTYSLFVDKDKEGNPIQPVVNVYIPRNERDGHARSS